VSSTLELWQTEWCPASHRVRERLTELELSYVIRQVPVRHEDRIEMRLATGVTEIPVLVAGARVITSEEAILAYLDRNFEEPLDADEQRAKAAKVEKRQLEEACPKLAAATR